jgi:hypothetical protein
MGIGKHVAHVQRTADCGRWSVNRKDIVSGSGPIKGVGAVLVPRVDPLGLNIFEGGLLRDTGHRT